MTYARSDLQPQSSPNGELGSDLVWRILGPQSWVNRRVEVVDFLDEDTLRRRVSIDCFVDGEQDTVVYVPLARLAKKPLVSFDLRDESSQALPVLTTDENGYLAWSALHRTAEMILASDVPAAIDADLRSVVFAPETQAERALRTLKTRPTHVQERERLFRSPAFEIMAKNLATGFLLIVPVNGDGFGRRIFKYSYTEPLGRLSGPDAMQSLGLRPFGIKFDVPAIGETGSYHLECSVPQGLQISSGRLSAKQPDGEVSDVRSGQGDRVHMMVSKVFAWADGEAEVELLPAKNGLIAAGLASALIVFALLMTAALVAHRIREGSDPAAAILLLGPGLLSALILHPGEHALASLVLQGLRWCVALVGACSAAGAGLIAIGVEGDALSYGLCALGSGSGLCAIVLFAASRVTADSHPEPGVAQTVTTPGYP